MHKNFSVIIFIITVIYIIYRETCVDKAYYLPSEITMAVYMDFIPPFVAAVLLDISRRIFKNKIAQRIILTLNIFMLGYTLFLIALGLMMSSMFD